MIFLPHFPKNPPAIGITIDAMNMLKNLFHTLNLTQIIMSFIGRQKKRGGLKIIFGLLMIWGFMTLNAVFIKFINIFQN